MSKENYSEIKTLINMSLFDKIELDELTERRLYINSPIDESIIDSIVFNILKFNREDRDIPSEKRKPVLLYINTPGGSVVDGFGLIDVILCSETPIYTINQALCASMGFLIFISGLFFQEDKKKQDYL